MKLNKECKLSEQEYLESLDIRQLLTLFEAHIKHSHYCPTKCYCFQDWDYTYKLSEIRDRIIQLTKVKR
jgi:hypothetical protein